MKERKHYFRQSISILVTVLLVLSIALCAYALVQVLHDGYANIGGIMLFRVVTGSMEPTIPTGALLIARQTAIQAVQVGDIVCFRSTDEMISGMVVTHRVTAVGNSSTGEAILQTKGDANTVADSQYVDADHFIGKVIWYSGGTSLLASIASLFSGNIIFLSCIIFPILILASFILRESVKGIQNELREVEQMKRQEAVSAERDPLCGMTQEEFNDMYDRIRTEMIEELKRCAEDQQLHQDAAIQGSDN